MTLQADVEGRMSNKRKNDLPAFDLERFTPYRLSVAAKRLSEGLARHYRQEFGLSIPEWRVLAHLVHSGNVSVRDIEASVAMEKYEVSRAAARLEQAGYIEKKVNEEDRRLVCLALTSRGEELMAKLLPLAMNYQKDIETRLASAFEGFEAGLDRLLKDAE